MAQSRVESGRKCWMDQRNKTKRLTDRYRICREEETWGEGLTNPMKIESPDTRRSTTLHCSPFAMDEAISVSKYLS
jgi:hypothetical protein